MSETIRTSDEVQIERLAIELDDLDWWPIATYSVEAEMFPIVEDADGKVLIAQLDEHGDWREVIDGQWFKTLAPLRWAIPTSEMVETFTFG